MHCKDEYKIFLSKRVELTFLAALRIFDREYSVQLMSELHYRNLLINMITKTHTNIQQLFFEIFFSYYFILFFLFYVDYNNLFYVLLKKILLTLYYE